MTTKLIGVKEFRTNLAGFYKKAQKNNIKYIILNRNKPIFEVTPLNKNNTNIENLVSDIKVARNDVKNRKTYSIVQSRKKLGL